MKAAVLRKAGEPLTIEDVELDAPRAGEVEIRVLAAGICHSDLHYMNGDLQGRLPAVLGHEGAGVVERVGEGVTRVKPGDTVITLWRPRCGDCEFCTTGRPALCPLGKAQAASGGLLDGTSRLSIDGEKIHHLMGVSCFAERSVVSERSVVAIDPNVPPQIAAITGCAVVTGAGAALNVMPDAAGDGVVVIGAGGVGLSAIMGLKLIGAYPIVAVDTTDTKLEKALELGATHTINSRTQDLDTELLRISRRPISWAVDAVGLPQTLAQAFAAIGTGGTVVALGLGKVGATAEVPINQLVQQEKKLIGSLYGSANTPVLIPKLIDLYQSGRLPLEKLLGDQYELGSINEAYESLARGATGRAVVLL
jgi:Zn-dependent alcohol dehydrogenase